MKKLLVPLAVFLLLALAVPGAFAASGIELGLSYTPVSVLPGQTSSNSDTILGFHGAYDWFIFTFSADSLAIPASILEGMTGVSVPGFINFFDAGLKLTLRPFEIAATLGTNYVYFYKGLGPSNGSWGANMRLLAGLNFGWWGVGLSGTAVFDTFASMVDTLKGLAAAETRTKALSDLTSGLVPSLYVTFYF